MATSEPDFYDILVIGTAGIGKSTTAKKIVKLESQDGRLDDEVTFESGNKTTAGSKCVLLSESTDTINDGRQRVRVLDVPGFQPNSQNMSQKLNIFYEILNHQKKGVKIRRVLYFLPNRGQLEKVDGTLMEELRALYSFFGNSIFNCMIIASTVNRKFQHFGFDEDEKQNTKKVFGVALKEVFECPDIECPPLIYVSYDDDGEKILFDIQSAPVKEEYLHDIPEAIQYPCSKCDAYALCYKRENREFSCVIENAVVRQTEESKCHPEFTLRYTKVQKFLGGLAHLLTLGIVLLFCYFLKINGWPGFTRRDEWICAVCGRSRKTIGCSTVKENYTVKGFPPKPCPDHKMDD